MRLDSADTFSLRFSVVIEICSAAQAAYPAGDSSVTILRGMPANGRRVQMALSQQKPVIPGV